MVANQTVCLNKGLSSNLRWLRSVDHMKFTEECFMRTEKHVLGKKLFTNGINIKVLGTVVNKEGNADSVLEHKRNHH